ncbi:hypothetical protein LC593_26710 [Nostoc sp. CHAB 5844]|nr:hypothetical protein [Nostoc sp. CHAB 5844]
MRNDINCLEPKGRETNCHSVLNSQLTLSKYSYIKKKLQEFWQKISKTLLADSNELQVWQKEDRQGNKYWCAYDPQTSKSFSSASEADIYMWIEQRYRYKNHVGIDFSNW